MATMGDAEKLIDKTTAGNYRTPLKRYTVSTLAIAFENI
jgi:hypothetical protein